MPLYSQEFPKCPQTVSFHARAVRMISMRAAIFGAAETNFCAQSSWLLNVVSRPETHMRHSTDMNSMAHQYGPELYSKPKQFEPFVIHAVPVHIIRPVRQPTNAITKL
jgi:hypothetical protein